MLVKLYSEVLSRFPNADIAANNMAQIIANHLYKDASLLDKARQTAERFAGSKNPLYLDTLGWVYIRLGNLQQAQVIMERVMSDTSVKLPEEVHYHYGSLLLKLSKTVEAKAELMKAVETEADYDGKEEAKSLLSGL